MHLLDTSLITSRIADLTSNMSQYVNQNELYLDLGLLIIQILRLGSAYYIITTYYLELGLNIR
jgi:uncharacterized membrane-anchored protein